MTTTAQVAAPVSTPRVANDVPMEAVKIATPKQAVKKMPAAAPKRAASKRTRPSRAKIAAPAVKSSSPLKESKEMTKETVVLPEIAHSIVTVNNTALAKTKFKPSAVSLTIKTEALETAEVNHLIAAIEIAGLTYIAMPNAKKGVGPAKYFIANVTMDAALLHVVKKLEETEDAAEFVFKFALPFTPFINAGEVPTLSDVLEVQSKKKRARFDVTASYEGSSTFGETSEVEQALAATDGARNFNVLYENRIIPSALSGFVTFDMFFAVSETKLVAKNLMVKPAVVEEEEADEE